MRNRVKPVKVLVNSGDWLEVVVDGEERRARTSQVRLVEEVLDLVAEMIERMVALMQEASVKFIANVRRDVRPLVGRVLVITQANAATTTSGCTRQVS